MKKVLRLLINRIKPVEPSCKKTSQSAKNSAKFYLLAQHKLNVWGKSMVDFILTFSCYVGYEALNTV